jgi:hypothetical protein
LVARRLAALRRHAVNKLTIPASQWDALCDAVRRIHLARGQGWLLAAKTLLPDVSVAISSLTQRLEELREKTVENNRDSAVSSAEVFRDLTALRDEFDEVQFDRESEELSVTTAPIELDGVDFGRFAICLDLTGSRLTYRVVALDPNPCSTKSHVTHPHVSDESLCEGDGSEAIRFALADCRLLDFFLLVSRILATYARGQAYVEIDSWQGSTCKDCGAEMDDEESRWCDRCNDSICCECSNYCAACEGCVCNSCGVSCSGCHSTCCRVCAETCDQCQRSFCPECLQDGLCPTCHENETDVDEEETGEALPEATTSIQPDRVGEAAVSAGLG